MQLPEFIKKAGAFFEKAESSLEKLVASLQGELDKAKARCTELSAALAKAEEKADGLQGELDQAKTSITAKDGEITNLKASLDTEKKRTNATLAAQGLLAEDVPIAHVNADATAGAGETAWAKYNRLLGENPMAAGQFWQANADKILDSRPKQ